MQIHMSSMTCIVVHWTTAPLATTVSFSAQRYLPEMDEGGQQHLAGIEGRLRGHLARGVKGRVVVILPGDYSKKFYLSPPTTFRRASQMEDREEFRTLFFMDLKIQQLYFRLEKENT